MIHLLPLALIQNSPSPEALVFAEAKKMVGGVWHGVVGDKIPVRVRFTLEENGAVIDGTGTVGDPKKPILRMHSRIGIDRASHQVYYLDTHGSDSIYFGHVTLKDGQLIFDFQNISGGTAHWINRATIKGNTQTGTLVGVQPDGTEKLEHTTTMTRSAK